MPFCARYMLEHLAEVAYEARMRGQPYASILLSDLDNVVELLRDLDKRSGGQTDSEPKGNPLRRALAGKRVGGQAPSHEPEGDRHGS